MPRGMDKAGKEVADPVVIAAGLISAIIPSRRSVASGVSRRAWVLISASFATRAGAWRMISKAM